MVSKASDDFPEPDSPVKTTSRSRGISRSTFLRLCSRAPRIVIARMADPALYWRFALITSSITGVPGALSAPRWGRASPGKPGTGRQCGCAQNVGRTRADFQCCLQAINGLLRVVAARAQCVAGTAEPAKRPARGRPFAIKPEIRVGRAKPSPPTLPPQLK